MGSIYIPIKVKQEASLLKFLQLLNEKEMMPVSELTRKIRKKSVYEIIRRLSRIEEAVQCKYSGLRIFTIQRIKVGKKKFLKYIKKEADIELERIDENLILAIVTQKEEIKPLP